jgi:hypothetical protein
VRKSLLGVLSILLLVLVVQAVRPAVRHWNHTRQVDELLRVDPFFNVIVTDNPAVREPLRTTMIQAYDAGRPEDAFVAGNTLLSPLLPKYLAKSSDSATVGFARSVVAGLKDYAAHDPDDCYRYLFPLVAGPPKRRSAITDQAMIDAIRRVVVEGSRSSPARPSDANPEALEPVYDRLRARHGEHLALLQRAETPDVDRQKICQMTTDLYNEIIQLPEREAAGALRYLLAESPQ